MDSYAQWANYRTRKMSPPWHRNHALIPRGRLPRLVKLARDTFMKTLGDHLPTAYGEVLHK